MEIAYLTRLSVDAGSLLHFGYTSHWFTAVLLWAWICSMLKWTFKRIRKDCSLYLCNRIVFCSSTGTDDIQLQACIQKDQGTQHVSGSNFSKPNSWPDKKFHSQQSRDSNQPILACRRFSICVVLDTSLGHHHLDTTSRSSGHATKYSTTMQFLLDLVEHHQSFYLRRNESCVPQRISPNYLL